MVGKRVYAIQPDAQPHHVELCSRITLYACRIAYMTQDFKPESGLQLSRRGFERLNLFPCKRIEALRVASCQMREDRTGNNRRLAVQTFYQALHILMRRESQTVHTRIYFDMNREIRHPFTFCCLYHFLQYRESVNIRLQPVSEHGLECRSFRIHNHNRTRNACLAQVGTFIRHSYRQVIHPMLFQCFCHFERTGSIRRCLHHAHQLRFRLQLIAVIIQVIHQRIQVDFENRLMYFQFQKIRNGVKMESACTFY